MVDYKKIEEMIQNLGWNQDELVVLEYIQKEKGYISKDVIKFIAEKMDKFDFSIENTVKFYPHLILEGDNVIDLVVCDNTPCINNGGGKLLLELKTILGIEVGEVTKDGKYRLETKRCFGQCGKGPNIKIGNKIYNYITKKDLLDLLK